jgi:LysR family transcriptional regulator, hydrogen peroxide-inducible genes activator
MELHQIRYFLAVERERNFSRAADACCITQPALTRAIQKLEEEFGGKLFTRRPGRIELTELGRAMLPRLQAAHREVGLAQTDATELLLTRNQRLRIGVMCTIGPARLVDLIGHVTTAMPSVDLHLTETKGTAVLSALLADELDVALVGLPAYPETVEATALFQETYVLAMPAEHRLAAANSVQLTDLDGENYIERTQCEYDDHFEAAHGEWPIHLNVRYRSDREDWVQAMIRANVGVAILPHSYPLIPGLTAAALVAPEVTRTISVVTPRGQPRSPAMRQLMHAIQSQSWG